MEGMFYSSKLRLILNFAISLLILHINLINFLEGNF